jgi:hypothetical protein
MKGQNENQAAKIQAYKSKVMGAEAPRMGFVNEGDPSHGVDAGPDRKHSGAVEKQAADGYGYKGYDEAAWKY